MISGVIFIGMMSHVKQIRLAKGSNNHFLMEHFQSMNASLSYIHELIKIEGFAGIEFSFYVNLSSFRNNDFYLYG